MHDTKLGISDIRLSPAQQRVLAEAARGNGYLHASGSSGGRGVVGRWNVLQTLELLKLIACVQADREVPIYEWELTDKGWSIGLDLPLAAAA